MPRFTRVFFASFFSGVVSRQAAFFAESAPHFRRKYEGQPDIEILIFRELNSLRR